MTSLSPEQSPVAATIDRLANHKNVRGVLILSRPTGIVLASSGQLFAPPPTPLPPTTARLGSSESTPLSSQDTVKPPVNGVDGGETVEVGVSVSEVARRYAASAVKMVEAVGEEVRTIGEEGDDLRLLRIRTRRHELIITPDEQYILVVAQDPSN